MDWIRLLSEIFAFLGIGYFIFYKAFVTELGKKTVELATSKQLTDSIESVKEKFNKDLESFKGEIQKDVSREIEPLKALLNRENIGFQIYTSEYARLRFQRLDDLYGSLYYFQKFVKDNLYNYQDEKDYQTKRVQFFKNYDNSVDKINLAGLYLDEAAKKSTYELLDQCQETFVAFVYFKNSQPVPIGQLYQGRTIEEMIERNNQAVNRLEELRNKFPAVLNQIEKEFKRNFTYAPKIN